MLDQSPTSEGMTIKQERCQPDYERMIGNLRVRLAKVGGLKDALITYHEGIRARDKMAELIGEVITEYNMIFKELNLLIEQQEKEGN